MKKEVLKEPIFAEKILRIIRSSPSMEEMPEQLRQEIGEKLSAQFLAQMATYHFSKEEIIHLLEAQAQQQEKEGTSC